MAWDFSAQSFVLGLLAGGITTAALLFLGALVVFRASNSSSLGHWKLNLKTPISSMWINLGFWKTRDGKAIRNFDQATRALLEQIVDTAGLLVTGEGEAAAAAAAATTTTTTTATATTATAAAAAAAAVVRKRAEGIAVLDLGFGCGDQTIALMEMLRAHEPRRFRYVGLTLDGAQVQTAQRRLDSAVAGRSDNDDNNDNDDDDAAAAAGRAVRALVQGDSSASSVKLLRADAARPETWSPVVRASVHSLADGACFPERWLLALDCLYHFSPSRRPAFRLAAQTLDAHLMAFDLLLDPAASRWNTCAVRLVGLVMGCPLHTFLTEAQYRQQLVECGYDGARIEVRDVSDDVFAGVAGYLRRQDAALGQYGISLGGFKLAGRLFEWFDRTRVVKAVIVVARTRAKL
ncbi:hypothetical protein AAL_04121 [Moelleriella libera RCEF 2490]|uniref:Methyltransferase domain-containing protein n=1 Tax=Moelleriella libera RCEF 2490 TaxID=1081109 RepID=A0A168BW94_9HYPO|nr:hypothetical protein AAL_04121 [Moelleriella libera RCEF 2490]